MPVPPVLPRSAKPASWCRTCWTRSCRRKPLIRTLTAKRRSIPTWRACTASPTLTGATVWLTSCSLTAWAVDLTTRGPHDSVRGVVMFRLMSVVTVPGPIPVGTVRRPVRTHPSEHSRTIPAASRSLWLSRHAEDHFQPKSMRWTPLHSGHAYSGQGRARPACCRSEGSRDPRRLSLP